jgi:hypothetical protein
VYASRVEASHAACRREERSYDPTDWPLDAGAASGADGVGEAVEETSLRSPLRRRARLRRAGVVAEGREDQRGDPDLLEDAQAVEFRHAQVEQEHVGLFALDHCQRFFSGSNPAAWALTVSAANQDRHVKRSRIIAVVTGLIVDH